ncbi:DUF3817 domain-containing protein [Aquimarina gracilis]|uniref:DUF3817 domain-containing protein n=1 Tax=Aquimarina gracilis TaxID=874422 RepID=A0ABU5ZYV5_9FLAO|nr:DUF3817 domain-containing protein [Aquimarina gracilis]MEB3347095.1 DUF3817 domain-containing protein [Aquimarina gracilis]
MKHYFNTNIGRLRILAFLEGISLLLLVFIAVPIKYILLNPTLVKWVGQIHGILFILFIFNTLKVGVEERWSFKKTTWKVILACFIPFGTFYIDTKILAKVHKPSAH